MSVAVVYSCLKYFSKFTYENKLKNVKKRGKQNVVW